MDRAATQRGSLSSIPTGLRLNFQYNPGSLQEGYEAGWAEVVIPGLESPILQFSAGKIREIPLELFFNIHGHNSRTNPINRINMPNAGDLNEVEEALLFIDQASKPKKINFGPLSFSASPDLMLFQFGRVRFGDPNPGMVCVIKNVRIERMMYNPLTLQATQARVQLSLVKFAFSSL
jgi:hypothetical protein